MASQNEGNTLSSSQGRKILTISPHADDIELGAGGYLARSIDQIGAQVLNVVVAVGDIHFEHLDRTVTADERVEECRQSMEVLGVSDLEILYWEHDSKMDTVPLSEMIDKLSDLIVKFDPDEILIPLPSSHQDHVQSYRACIAATRPSSRVKAELVAAYEYPSSVWHGGPAIDAGKGGMYVEVAPYWQQKLDALGCYKTQMRDDGHCFSTDAADAMSRMRAFEVGFERAELVYVLRRLMR